MGRRRPSPTLVVAVIALIAAAGGTAFAAKHAGLLSGKRIAKRSQPGNRFKKDTITGKEVKEKTLTGVANAKTLGGQTPTAFLGSAPIKRFNLRLSFGQTQPVFSAGPFTFTARCLSNVTNNGGNPNADLLQVLISTTQNGAVFDGADFKDGSTPADFLDTNTPESDRVFYETSRSFSGPAYDAEASSAGGALAADGTAVAFQTDGVAVGLNELGADCSLQGFAVATN